MNNDAQQIKERLNITDVISGFIRLQKAGVNYKALCPFHNEKTPSFMVSPSRQSWHCFGCGEGGDIFTFVQKIENVEFPEALKILAERAGVTLEYGDPKLRSEKDRLYEICEIAARFFTDSLNNLVVNYLHRRGLNDETIGEWRLGYAPDSWDSVFSFLKAKGFKEAEIEKTGLILRGQKMHDRFRNRLMFPICDVNNRVVAFSGRIMHDVIPSKTEKIDSGKYINSPETILYNKSRILYGLNRAKNDIRRADKAVITEGQMDVILPWQDGVKNIVATSGTALTEDQLIILKRLTGNLVMAFDMDDAGSRATKRGVDLARASGFNVLVLSLESGKDAADFVKENPGKFRENISKSEPFLSYYFKETFKKFDPVKLESKKFVALTILSEIKRAPSAIERSSWIRDLSLRLGVSESDLKEEMEQIELQNNVENALMAADNFHSNPAPSRSRKEILSERLLALLLKKPEFTAEAAKIAAYLLPRDLEFLTVFSKNGGNFSETRLAMAADRRSRLDFLHLLGDYEFSKMGSDFDIGKEITFVIKEIEREHCKELLLKIGYEIKKREIEGADADSLTKDFQDISKKLHQLNSDEKTKKI